MRATYRNRKANNTSGGARPSPGETRQPLRDGTWRAPFGSLTRRIFHADISQWGSFRGPYLRGNAGWRGAPAHRDNVDRPRGTWLEPGISRPRRQRDGRHLSIREAKWIRVVRLVAYGPYSLEENQKRAAEPRGCFLVRLTDAVEIHGPIQGVGKRRCARPIYF